MIFKEKGKSFKKLKNKLKQQQQIFYPFLIEQLTSYTIKTYL